LPAFTKAEILRLLRAPNKELRAEGTKGTVNLVGGAVMCLAFDARPATRDIDASFKPSVAVRAAAVRVAAKENITDHWLNDAAKTYLSDNESYNRFEQMDHLTVFCAAPEYMLAMKCLAVRFGEGFQDLNDIRYLLTHLAIEKYEDALEIIEKYYPNFPPHALSALRDLLPDQDLTKP
jgi:hypothetical protein